MKKIEDWYVGQTQLGFPRAIRRSAGGCMVLVRNAEGLMIQEWACSQAAFDDLVKTGIADLTSITAVSVVQMPLEALYALTGEPTRANFPS